MSIHCIKQPNGVCNCGRPPCGVVVSYSRDEIMGYFFDALSRGEPKNSRIIGYIWDEPSSKTHAIIFNALTGEVSEYAMNIQTRKPYWVRTIRVQPVNHKRPRKFGLAMWRATKAWQERDE